MKTRIKLLAMLALTLGMFGQHASASAATVFKFKDQGADAFFQSRNGCIRTEVFVITTNGQFQNPPGPAGESTAAALHIFQYDECSQQVLLDARGSTYLDESAFQISRELDVAALDAAMLVQDEVSGSTFEVAVDLTWTAPGPLIRRNDNFHFHNPGCNQNIHQNVRYRMAQASGSVSNGMNYTPEPTGAASIFFIQDGYVTAGCS